MKRIVKAASVATVAVVTGVQSAAASEYCEDLWFTRNSMMDRAGYCFGSTLGQALFDNSDCVGQQITLTPEQSALVDDLRRREAAAGCSVDTGRTALTLSDHGLRTLLEVQPVRLEGDNNEGWGCLGYLGPSVQLHGGPHAASAPVGRIDQSDWVSVGGYEQINGWTYVTTHHRSWGGIRSGGWMRPGTPMTCEAEAG